MNQTLTKSAVSVLANSSNAETNPNFQPVVQILNVKRVGGGSQERWRVVISDGEHFIQGMLATQINHFITSNEIQENSIIKINDNMTNLINNRIIVIVLNLEVLNSTPGLKIGNPVDVGTAPSVGGASVVTAAKPLYGNNVSNPAAQSKPEAVNSNPYGQSRSPSSNPYGSSNSSRTAPQSNSYSNSNAPIVRSNMSLSEDNHTPISQLNMYQNRWTVKARVTSKSDIRTWSNARGEGSLFSCDILDSSGTDIRCTFFKEAVDKFHPMLQMDHVYTFTNGRLKVANAQYNTCKSNFEVSFDQNAEVHEVADDGRILQQQYEFLPISAVEQTEPNSNIDLLVVVKEVHPIGTVMSKKTGQELFKCDLTVVDQSNVEINLTVWGEKAKTAEANFANQPIVAFKRLRVSDYGGRSLSSSGNGGETVNPRIPEVQPLQHWWNTQGRTSSTLKSLSTRGGGGRMDSFADRKTLSAIKTDNMGYGEKPDWMSVKATFSFVKKDKEGGPWYTACVNEEEPCRQRVKVTQTTDGYWHCDRCNKTSEKCKRRYIFSATIADETSTSWVSLFDEQALQFLGEEHTADSVYDRYFSDSSNGDTEGFDGLFAKATSTDWIVKCKVKNEMVGDESRVKTTIYSLTPMDYVKESRDLLEAISKLSV
mmetsp:Transcript_38141/g.44412  ORF Transcript_38141/g.44412 Transcript_38141/m.44412 type:complete len:652 (+) Transcript_38141:281-2236(+)|eukprot:CAMPEP_0194371894 /NCGR_PEP_ID=MMETSP0174-20130528/20247_1 /TAXON_ID=216777 /ORGANISM="Proboscia alata, Strain PI-D3" /LENGTH=651 /DNA_ID=CAMNT_0039150139 /DNA_START=240 /DNA_END=2195 /DNA_ORIENTATION=-